MANETQDRIAQALADLPKFSNWKKNGLGKRDATYRFGVNIPYDTPANFSAGYTGGAIRDLSEEFLEGEQ